MRTEPPVSDTLCLMNNIHLLSYIILRCSLMIRSFIILNPIPWALYLIRMQFM